MEAGHYFLNLQIIGRSAGKSAVASSAYRSGERLHDEHANKTYNYSKKRNIEHTEIFAPATAPAWVQNRGKLWNAVEASEKRKDAQLAREVMVSLPRALSPAQRVTLVRDFVQQQFVSQGMIADVSWHNPKASDGAENPHAHILLTLREISPEGFGKKNREWNTAIFAKDDRIKDKQALVGIRAAWAEAVNHALADSGSTKRVSHLSHEAQGFVPANPSIPNIVRHIQQRTGKSHVFYNLNQQRHQERVEQATQRLNQTTPPTGAEYRHYNLRHRQQQAVKFTLPPPDFTPPNHQDRLRQQRTPLNPPNQGR